MKIMGRSSLVFLASTIALMCVPLPGFADFTCTVDVNKVLIYSNGIVNVLHSGRGNYTHICSLQQEYKGVSITTCAMWASMLANFQEKNRRAVFYYNDEAVQSCAELPTYNLAPAPIYIGNGD